MKQLFVKDVEMLYEKNYHNKPEPIFYEIKEMDQEKRFQTYSQIYSCVNHKNVEVSSLIMSFKTFKQSFNVYVLPHVYMGDLRYFSAKEKQGIFKYFEAMQKEWKNVCIGEFTLEEIEGNHFTCIENEVYANHLAELLSMNEDRKR